MIVSANVAGDEMWRGGRLVITWSEQCDATTIQLRVNQSTASSYRANQRKIPCESRLKLNTVNRGCEMTVCQKMQ